MHYHVSRLNDRSAFAKNSHTKSVFSKMVQVFISCQLSEALEQAEMLENALIGEGILCFLCSIRAGDWIGEAAMENLIDPELVVILGTKAYG